MEDSPPPKWINKGWMDSNPMRVQTFAGGLHPWSRLWCVHSPLAGLSHRDEDSHWNFRAHGWAWLCLRSSAICYFVETTCKIELPGQVVTVYISLDFMRFSTQCYRCFGTSSVISACRLSLPRPFHPNWVDIGNVPVWILKVSATEMRYSWTYFVFTQPKFIIHVRMKDSVDLHNRWWHFIPLIDILWYLHIAILSVLLVSRNVL